MNLNDAIALRIEELLQEYHITQYRLAQLSGVSQSSISDLRHKKSQSINLVVIYELADGLGLGLDEFFKSPLFKRENLE